MKVDNEEQREALLMMVTAAKFQVTTENIDATHKKLTGLVRAIENAGIEGKPGRKKATGKRPREKATS